MIMMIMTTMMIINVVETYSQDLQGRRPRPFVEWALKSLPCEPCGIWGWTVSQSHFFSCWGKHDIHLHVGEGKDWGKGPQSGGPAGGNLDKASMIMSMMILMIMVIMMIVM